MKAKNIEDVGVIGKADGTLLQDRVPRMEREKTGAVYAAATRRATA